MVPLFDTHVHLDFLPDLPTALARADAAGVGRFVVPGVSLIQCRRLPALAAESAAILIAPGLHPLHADEWGESFAAELEHLLEHPHAVAVGEVGLDRNSRSPAVNQERLLRRLIGLARNLGKPLLIHQRRAIGRVLEILRQERADGVGGILHAFSGSLESARQAIDLGFALGIGGVVTHPQSRRLPELVRQLPADWLVLETDAPDLPPHPHRGSDNRPEYLPLIAARVAELRHWSRDDTARITSGNAARILGLAAD
ncbi:MAG: TatD family hydrolase [Desulfuromonadales bacterium]|nr:TatD family hydrolase [Desulfuromonadales bacterium]